MLSNQIKFPNYWAEDGAEMIRKSNARREEGYAPM
jgi:hypothetical protein